MLGGVCSRTMKRFEERGQLTPIKLNSRLVVYRLVEVLRIISHDTQEAA
jgi:hypothetical protein